MKILINALSGNGDALMYSPCINLLKKKMPDCEIHLLAMFRSVMEMYETSPYIDKIFFIDFNNSSPIIEASSIIRISGTILSLSFFDDKISASSFFSASSFITIFNKTEYIAKITEAVIASKSPYGFNFKILPLKIIFFQYFNILF